MSRLLLLRVATRPFAALAPLAAPEWTGAERELSSLDEKISGERKRLEATLYEAAGPAGAGVSHAQRHAILAVLRSVHNGHEIRESDAALLPPALREELARHQAMLARRADLEHRCAGLLEDAEDAALDAIARAFADPLVREGISSSSSELAAKLDRLFSRPGRAVRHGERHVLAKSLAYVARFSTKTSPNGVFCATSLATFDGDACLVAGSPAIERFDVLLSVAEARKVACTLASDPAVEAAVVPRRNPTLREEPGGYTFWRLASARHPDDKESLSRVRPHPALAAVLEEMANGARFEPASLRQLIDAGIVIGEIEIPYAERRPLRYVATRARAAGCEAAWIEQVLALEDEVDALAASPLAEREGRRRSIAQEVAALPRSRPLERDELFRTDAKAVVAVTLPSSILEEIRGALSRYARLFAAMYPASRYRSGWVARFLSKFPADAEVEMLDVYRVLTEQGDTYRPAAFPEPEANDEAARSVLAGARDALADRGVTTLPALLAAAGIAGDPEPRWAAGVLFQVGAADAAAIERGDYHLVLNGLFQGAGLSLSRFAHLLGEEAVTDELRRAWSVVERTGAIVAELTYNHLGRTANAGLRPAIFPYEIELPGDCVSDGATRLTLADLTVRWDGRDGRFVLTWKSGGVEVIPVINSGVSPVGFISFLVAIGEQGFQPVGYLPGFDREDVVHWPRVTDGRVVVFRERWVFRRPEWPEPTPRGLVRWRDAHRLPRHVFAHSSREPKPRYIDLDSPSFLDLLRRDVEALGAHGRATLEITEMLPGPGELWLGGHACEFLVQTSSPWPRDCCQDEERSRPRAVARPSERGHRTQK
ncbi:MAG TPA: lantibiotic dehydratase [Candidatus Polarisedimenticolaceae bacterium]|nr:lantibiotic dehydratase [Candidatus Polarisedimenticolaceae bacterium]